MSTIATLLLPKDNVFNDLDLTQEQQTILYAILEEIIEIKILDTVVSALANDDQKVFAQMVKDATESTKVEHFLRDRIPNLDTQLQTLLVEAEQEIRQEIVQHIA